MSLSNDSCIVQKIRAELFLLSDDTYRDFSSRLMPTVDPAAVLGVRIPQLRKMAASLRGDEAAEEFLSHLPHLYYEENNLHAFLIAQIKDFSACVIPNQNNTRNTKLYGVFSKLTQAVANDAFAQPLKQLCKQQANNTYGGKYKKCLFRFTLLLLLLAAENK